MKHVNHSHSYLTQYCKHLKAERKKLRKEVNKLEMENRQLRRLVKATMDGMQAAG